MNSYWAVAAVVLGVLFLGYCSYSADRASKDFDRALDSMDRQACYAAGYEAGLAGRDEASGPAGDAACAGWFETGFAQGKREYEMYEGAVY